MANAKTDHLEERHERLAHLVKEIYAATLDSEYLRDFNVLAMILLARGLDILYSCYDEETAMKTLDKVIAERHQMRTVPLTSEYIRKIQEMNRWLPAED